MNKGKGGTIEDLVKDIGDQKKKIKKAKDKYQDMSELRNEQIKLNHMNRELAESEDRVAFVDIETTGLTANFGMCLTYVIGDKDPKIPLIVRHLKFKDLHTGNMDKYLQIQFCKDIKDRGYKRLVVHYGGDRRFDLPFMRTRATYWNSHGVVVPFPVYEDNIYLIDTWKILKDKFRLSSNRLATVCEFFGIPAKHHPLKGEVWTNLFTGNRKKWQEAIKYIIIHNKEDVVAMRKLWKYIGMYANYGKVRI